MAVIFHRAHQWGAEERWGGAGVCRSREKGADGIDSRADEGRRPGGERGAVRVARRASRGVRDGRWRWTAGTSAPCLL